MNKYKKYCCGSMGLFSTYNPLFVGWTKTKIGRGMFWENEYFVDPSDPAEIHICESAIDDGGYLEVYPLYSDTHTTPSLNQITYGVITEESEKKSEMEAAGFWSVYSNYGYTDFRVPSLELNKNQSKILMKGIVAEVDESEEAKEQFSFFKTQLTLVNGDDIITVLDCGEKVYEKEINIGDGHFEFTLSFAGEELKLSYTNEQSRLLIECLK